MLPAFARVLPTKYLPILRSGSTSASFRLRRPFFASSTDHERLLQEAEVHCLDQQDDDDTGIKEYVMVASGLDFDTVKKVPHLHLARLRLSLKDKTLYGARVVNRTLGTRDEVCGKLVDAALKDAGPGAQARSNLHGLSEWVLRGLRNEVFISSVANLSDSEVEAVTAIAEGSASNEVYESGRKIWEDLIEEFIEAQVGDEATLYQSKGATFVSVQHHADDSDYADTSGGAMAMFSFE